MCARYRCTDEGLTRCTTIDLLVEQVPRNKRQPAAATADTEIIAVMLEPPALPSDDRHMSIQQCNCSCY